MSSHQSSSTPSVRPSLAIQMAVAVALVVSVFLAVLSVSPAEADGVNLVFTSEPGCYQSEWYSVGLKGDGIGTINIEPGPGPIIFASLAWTGTNDTSPDAIAPGGDRADSTLILNGTPVVGTQPAGDVGYADLPTADWFAWSARIGPDTLGIIDRNTTTLEIAGWDGGPGPEYERTGALLSIVYDTSPCKEATIVYEYEGVDYFYQGNGDPSTGTVFLPVDNAPEETSLQLPFALAGSEVDITGCRGVALWLIAGSGPVPEFASFDLVDNSVGSGFGINGGVEIVNDPFSHPSGSCVAKLNQAPPNVAYAGGHPYPNGAADSPYRALSIRPPRGPSPKADIALSIVDVSIPPGSDWIGFQFESEPEEGGESGAWISSQTILRPAIGVLGDQAWFDQNGNCLQDPGEVGVAGVTAELQDGSGVPLATMATDAGGKYLFRDLAAGDYRVKFTVPDGYEIGLPDCGADDNIDSDPVPDAQKKSGVTGIVSLRSAGDLSVDVGLTLTATDPAPTPAPIPAPPEVLAFTGLGTDLLWAAAFILFIGVCTVTVSRDQKARGFRN